jgi:hypothetical protein
MSRLLKAAAAAALIVTAAAPAAAQLKVERRADLALPVTLGPGQGAILVGFRRSDTQSQNRHGSVAFARYDREARDIVPQPRGARRAGDTTTYWVLAKSGVRTLAQDHSLMIVSEGDYVMYGASPMRIIDSTFCLGAPTFRVRAGEVVYFGDVTPYLNVRMEGGRRASAMAYSSDLEKAREALASQPALVSALRPAEISNQATFGCIAQNMLAYSVPGAADLPPPSAAPAASPASADAPAQAQPASAPDTRR